MVERDQISQRNHCHLCPKDCSSPDYDTDDRIIVRTSWEKVSIPAHFSNCSELRELIDFRPNMVPMVTS